MSFRRNSAFDQPSSDELQKVVDEFRTENDKLEKSNGNLNGVEKRLAANHRVLDDVHNRMTALIIYLEGNSQVPPYVIQELEDIDREIYAELR